ncbi:MAG: ABC-type transport auxiliary lipoprotein family protein [Gammaproteobacteria bacterium]
MYNKLIILSMVLFITACSSLKPQSVPQQATYTLQDSASTIFTTRPTSHTLLVSAPVANPGYDSSNMIYTQAQHPYQLQSYTRHQWVAPPADMLLPLLANRLSNRNYFHAVVTPPHAGITDRRLDTRLISFKQEFSKRHASRAHIMLRAELINNDSSKVIASRLFEVETLAPSNDPQGNVIASNDAISKLLSQITEFAVRNSG